MFEEAWCETCVSVDVELEVFDKRNIVNPSCLLEAIRSFANFDMYSVVTKEVFNIIFINENLGGNPSW